MEAAQNLPNDVTEVHTLVSNNNGAADDDDDGSESDFFDCGYANELDGVMPLDIEDSDSNIPNSDNNRRTDDSDSDDIGNSMEGSVSSTIPDLDNSNSDVDNSMEGSISPPPGIIQRILILFFRMQFHFNITNRAANAILSLISFVLCIVKHPLSTIFPKTVRTALSASGIHNSIPKKMYAVCPREKCNALYTIDGRERCSNVIYGKVCGAELGYERHLSHGKVRWTPFKKFQFIHPSAWLKHMFQSHEFVRLINLWRSLCDHKYIDDLYDGRIWKDMEAQGFFKDNNNLGLMLNVDWFKPMKRSEYKVAAIMLTILNLPREERFKKKWTIIAGMFCCCWHM